MGAPGLEETPVRPGRAAVHTALPLVALAALAVLGAVRPPAPEPAAHLSAAGTGWVASQGLGRVVTDGRPQLVQPPVRRVATAPVSARALRRPVAPTQAPVPARLARPEPQPTAVPRGVSQDGYPYATDTTGGSDPWGFTKRQCVSYVGWRLAELGRPLDNARDDWGSALDWDEAAARTGHAVGTRPAVGTVAHWDAGERSAYWSEGSSTADGTFVAGGFGHVAWVLSVYADGSVLVAQYNGTADRSYSTMRVKAPRFLSL